MNKIIVLATRNKHKLEEISALLPGLSLPMKTLYDFPGAPEVAEDGRTLRENAAKKARSAALFCRTWALADDTGLFVDALGGEPGVYSARYAGPGCSYAENNEKLLAAMTDVPGERRTARFCCVMALSSPEGTVSFAEGQLEGSIAQNISGAGGFGYDPLFLVAGINRTLAELSAEAKNSLSHRFLALKNIAPQLARLAEKDLS